MRIIFFGTPDFAAQQLSYLLEHRFDILAVVTQPDRPKGRSGALAPSEVKELALQKALPVLQPKKASDPNFLEELKKIQADLYVVVAFGQILPQKLLDLPRLGCINVHASLLPKYRGAAPMQRCLMHGVSETGVSIQKMVKQLDAGDVIAEKKIAVPLDMNLAKLKEALSEISEHLLASVILSCEKGIPPAHPPDPEKVTFAPKITTEERQIDWKGSALQIHNKVRALSPRPGAWCWTEQDGVKKRLKIISTRPIFETGPWLQFDR
ncbi:MAG: methionyl-tRNA formyltransferase, partial [Chlamydiae bacterium]|nr:methionyl-tRNA formyltransferase [Chlamydiota bacterium]